MLKKSEIRHRLRILDKLEKNVENIKLSLEYLDEKYSSVMEEIQTDIKNAYTDIERIRKEIDDNE